MDQNMETQPESPAEEDNLRASLEASFTEAEGKSQEQAAAAPVEGQSADRHRDENGRFAQKPDAAPEQAAPGKEQPAKPAETVTPAADNAAKASDQKPSNASEAPPVSWAADAKAEWSNLSPALKAAIVKRETEVSNGFRQYSEQTRRFEQMLSPLDSEARRLGMQSEQALNALLAAHHMLNRDPVAGIRQLAQQFGVDLGTMTGPEPGSRSSPAPMLDPRVDGLAQWVRNQQIREEQTIEQTVTSFASSHPHFEAVQTEMMAMLPHLKSANPFWAHDKLLQEAYDRAVYANPEVRSAILAEQSRADEEKRRKTAADEASKARLAGSPVRGSPVTHRMPEAKGTLREELEAAYDAR